MSAVNHPAVDEDSLEPQDLIRRSHLIVKGGQMMLAAGTSSLRVRELMQALARSLGMDALHATITYTDLVVTVNRRGTFRTQVGEARRHGVNAHRIAQLQQLTRRLSRGEEVDIERTLRRIEHTAPLHRPWLLVVLVALACASVTVLGHGSWREILAVIPASALAYALHRSLVRAQINFLAVVVTSATTASALYLGFAALVAAALGTGPSDRLTVGLVCSLIFLVPGFPLVTAGLDLTRLDLQAGVPRLAYALMVLLAMAIGLWLVAALAGIKPTDVGPLSWSPPLLWTVSVVASFTAVFAWAMMFNSPTAAAVASGVIAAIGNVPRLLMLERGVSNHVATFVSCVLIGLLCAGAGRLLDLEKIIMTVPTLLVSIPGAAALRTLLYFDSADIVRAMANGVETALGVIAMVGGLSVARMVTDPEWAFTRPDPPRLRLRLGR